MTDANTIRHDVDLLGDWLDAKGYTEEAGLCLRVLGLIREQQDEIEKLREALRPFADVAKHDICESLTDADIFRPMTREYSRASMLTVGDLRKARKVLGETNGY